MWYVIVLALSACGNCWAMKELVTVYRDALVAGSEIEMRQAPNNNVLWESAKEFHESVQKREQQKSKKDEAPDVLIDEEKLPLYARCIAYLNEHRDDAALSATRDRRLIVHGFDKGLVLVPVGSLTCNEDDKPRADILHAADMPDGITFTHSAIDLYKKLEDNELCPPYGQKNDVKIIGIDSLNNIHLWKVSILKEAAHKVSYWKGKVPGAVTAICEQLSAYHTVIFYQDRDNTHRAGLLLSRDVATQCILISGKEEFKEEHGFVPSTISDATHVTIRGRDLPQRLIATVYSKYWSRSYNVTPHQHIWSDSPLGVCISFF